MILLIFEAYLEKKGIKINGTKEEKATDILGIYGQNGSGKTSVINGLYLLKMVAWGRSLSPNFCNFISYDDNYAALTFEFRIIDEREVYKVFYKFYMRKIHFQG